MPPDEEPTEYDPTARHYTFRWYEYLILWIVCPLAALLIKLLCLSCRVVRVEGKERDLATVIGQYRGGAVYCTWHQRMFYFFHYFGARHVTMMISRSKDGEYAARVAHRLGFRSVRGSSTRGGSAAWRELVRRVRDEGQIAGMLVDGPKGPPRVAKMGTVLIARDAGVPIVPMMYGVDRCWQVRSWDRYIVVKPFARVSVIHGEPILVPKDAEGEELEKYRRLLEDRMNECLARADAVFGVPR